MVDVAKREDVPNEEALRQVSGDYKYGWVTDIESDFAPKGLNEDIVRFISEKKGEPEWLLEWRLKAYRRWLEMEDPEWARLKHPRDRLPGCLLLRRAQEAGAEEPRRGRSRHSRHLQEARHSAEGTGSAGRHPQRRGGRGVRFRLGRDHLPRQARGARRDLLLDLGSGARASRARAEISRHGRPLCRQFLRHAQFGGVFRRHLRLCAEGREMPDGALDLFPHQRRQDRPVRAHA